MSFASELRHLPHGPSQGPAAEPRRLSATHRRGRRDATPTPYPFAKAFACAGLAYAVATAILLGFALPATPDGRALMGALGIFAIASFVPALITGMVVCQSPRVWPFWRIALVFLPMFSLVAVLHASGAAAG
jgi:hypothetical protein